MTYSVYVASLKQEQHWLVRIWTLFYTKWSYPFVHIRIWNKHDQIIGKGKG